MNDWLDPALAYAAQWLNYQAQAAEQPGCVFAVAREGRVIAEQAFGVADLRTGERLTPAHRFRVASHSKTFTAAGILKLQEAGRLRLGDAVGAHVPGLDAAVADVTIGQVLSHSAGLGRDGRRSPHWQAIAPFFEAEALSAELALPPAIDPNTRFKYSNLGFGLLGRVIEAVTGESYERWIGREIVAASGLESTTPDMPSDQGTPMATGHSRRIPFGRGIVDGHQPTHALAAATGFVSTAGDLARFFGSLDPAAEASVLSVASRREMTRIHWQVPEVSEPRSYGLGTMVGNVDGRAVIGHGGAFPGFISRSAFLPDWGLGVSVVTNAVDGLANPWLEGIVSILHRFAQHGAPEPRLAGWAGRWWTIWGAMDLVPMGDKVLAASPGLPKPLTEASELTIDSDTNGRIVLAGGFAHHGEKAERELGPDNVATALWLGGSQWWPNPEGLAVSFDGIASALPRKS